MKKKIISLFMIIMLFTNISCAYAASIPETFSDVPASHWAYEQIYSLQNTGAISGDGSGNFNPDGNVTREQFLKIVIDALGVPPTDAQIEFKDVKKDAWYESYIKTGIANGIVTGKSKDLFGVGECITRQDACVMLMRASCISADGGAELAFGDKEQISDYAKSAVSALTANSVIAGFDDNTFRPMELCTRSQAAKIIKCVQDIDTKLLDNAKRIVFLGDSLTNAGEYLIYVNAFLKTRFPNNKVEVMFGGRDGEMLTNMLARYDDDVLGKGADEVFILFGANDVNRGLYPDGEETKKENAINNAVANLETLIGKLRKDGIRSITLLTPPTVDERVYKGASENKRVGVSGGLKKMSDRFKEVGKKYGIRTIDLNTPTEEILNARKDSGEVEIYKTDRIHPNRVGHFVMANEIIQNIYGSYGLVASVAIDIGARTFKADNATVSGLSVADDKISYTYKAKALPMGIDEKDITEAVAGNGYSDAEQAYPEFVNFTEKMNREIIKVNGLAEGTYSIAFDGKIITTATAEELASGVNIATLPENPGQIKAKAIIDSYMRNYWTQIKVRRCEVLFREVRKAGMMGASHDELTAWVKSTYPGNAGWESFLTLYQDADKYKAQWDYLERTAYKTAQPQAYEVTITPAQ